LGRERERFIWGGEGAGEVVCDACGVG